MIEYCVEIKFEIILSRGHHFISCFSKQKKINIGEPYKGQRWTREERKAVGLDWCCLH